MKSKLQESWWRENTVWHDSLNTPFAWAPRGFPRSWNIQPLISVPGFHCEVPFLRLKGYLMDSQIQPTSDPSHLALEGAASQQAQPSLHTMAMVVVGNRLDFFTKEKPPADGLSDHTLRLASKAAFDTGVIFHTSQPVTRSVFSLGFSSLGPTCYWDELFLPCCYHMWLFYRHPVSYLLS